MNITINSGFLVICFFIDYVASFYNDVSSNVYSILRSANEEDCTCPAAFCFIFGIFGGCMGINLLILRFFEACKNSLQSSSIEFMYADKDF